jgi:hypothetical protein
MWLPRSVRPWIPVFVALAAGVVVLAACAPQVGKSCSLSTDCSQLGDRLCDTTQPGGYCTVFNCEPDQCPSSTCVAFNPTLDPSCGVAADGRWPRYEQSFCLAACNSEGDCRTQYDCVDLSDPTKQIQRGAQVVDQFAGDTADGGLGFKVCMASGCGDGLQDYNESDVDCGGGNCTACGNGLRCGQASDCLSGNCVNNVCLGSQVCQTNAECSSGVCNNADPVNGCPPATNCSCIGTNCTDGKLDGLETDVDCGGADCGRCASTLDKLLHCLVPANCASGLCYANGGAGTSGGGPATCAPTGNASMNCVCNPGDCRNGKQDGVETDVDCGGGGCAPCLLDQKCLASTDCKSNNCLAGKCAPPAVCSVADAGAAWTPYAPDAGSTGSLDAGDGG